MAGCCQTLRLLVALVILGVLSAEAATLERQNNFGRLQRDAFDRLRADVEQSAHKLLTSRQQVSLSEKLLAFGVSICTLPFSYGGGADASA
jgi:hypothetical protein